MSSAFADALLLDDSLKNLPRKSVISEVETQTGNYILAFVKRVEVIGAYRELPYLVFRKQTSLHVELRLIKLGSLIG